ncbi:MAG: DEAD/DEAH box helicase [Candidatus Bathyarchaeia archaeon]
MSNNPMIALRPYQQIAVESALKVKRGTIKAATGTGKTIIAIEWIKQVAKETLIVVPTQALIYQSWAPKLQEAGLLEVGQYYAHAKTEGPVMITTYSSATSHPELLEKAEAVVMDEIHHLGAQTALLRLLPRLVEKEYVLGLSSVPEREDETHRLFLKQFPICFDLGLGDALRTGIVSPLKVTPVRARMNNKERSSYEKYTEKIQAAFKFCGPSITTWMNCFDPETKKFVGRQGMLALSRRKKLLSRVESKKEQILEILSRHKDQMVILFSESVQAVEEIKEILIAHGISCETFHSKVEPWRRMEILEDWGRRYDVLLSCRALEEGLDVKEVGIGILITSGRSKRQFIQRIGRIIRPVEGKVASFYVVYCPQTVEETYTKTIAKILTNE